MAVCVKVSHGAIVLDVTKAREAGYAVQSRRQGGVCGKMTVRNSGVARVLIADTTIRDEHLLTGDAQLLADLQRSEVWRSAALSVPRRVLAARQLAELGVDLIEAGFGEAQDLLPLEAVASEFQDGGPVISVAVRALGDEERLAAAWDAVSTAAKPRLHLYTAANDLVDDQGRFRRHPQRLLDETRSAVARARRLAEDVEFSPPRTSPNAVDIAAEWTQAAVEEGARTINVRTADDHGDPETLRAVLLELIRLVPDANAVDFSADPFIRNLRGGKASAAALSCAEAAIEAGCRQLKCAFHGIAGTPGHVPLELLTFNIWLRKHLGESHLWTGVDPTKLCQASARIAAAKGLDIPPTQPVVGASTTDPQLADFPDDPLERAQAAAALQIVLQGLGRPIPGWLADWIEGRVEGSKAA